MAEDKHPYGRHFASSNNGEQRHTPPVPPSPARSASPDETSVFIAAAREGSLTAPGRRAPRPDETAMFVAAAERAQQDASQHTPAIMPNLDDFLAFDDNATGAPANHASASAAPSPLGDETSEFAAITASAAEEFAYTPVEEDAYPADPAPAYEPEPASASAGTASRAASSASAKDDEDFESAGDYESVGRSASLMTGLIIISRLTGFVRTWAMGIAFGVSYLASSYNIANNLPNMLYEMVMGGMLVTAFLPIYLDARRNGGREEANEYVGNLLSILLVVLGAVSLLAIFFAPQLIWTQSFMSDGNEMDVAIYFFRFFAVQVLFYGLGSVFSGVLNAHRDYFWSNFAPILNNVVVIASFLSFIWLEHVNQALGITVLAVGTSAGVFVQMACQIPALAKHGIRPRLHINLHDPRLRQTVSLGIPTVVATICTFVISSVQNSSALAVEPGAGASVIAYSRLWYTLPYALLSISLTTALYTELARDAANGDDAAVRRGISNGVGQQLFLLIPFAFYLMVFSFPLNMIYCSGKFDLEGVELVSNYLQFLAPALPLYGVCILMQKGCSALMNMKPYAVFMLCGTVAQIAWSLTLGVRLGGGLPFIALSNVAFYVVADFGALIWMRRRLHGINLKAIVRGALLGLVLGGLGALAGAGMLRLLETFVGPLVSYAANGTAVTAGAVQTFVYVVVAGLCSLVVTFGPAVALKLPEAATITSVFQRFKR